MSMGVRAVMSPVMRVPGETARARARAAWRRGGNLGHREGRQTLMVTMSKRVLGSWGIERGWGQALRNKGFRGQRSCR